MARRAIDSTDAYRALCAAHDVPLFHQPWWLDATCERWMGVTAESGNTTALWPVPLEKKLGVSISRNPALTPYLGPVVLGTRGDESALFRTLLSALPRIPVWYTAGTPRVWEETVFSDAGFTTGHRPTYLLPLTGMEEDALFSGLHTELRRTVRRAAERIVIADEPGESDAMYELQQATLRRKGTRLYYSAAHFSRLVQEAHTRGCGALWTARRDGEIVGAQWSLWDSQRCYNIGLARREDDRGKHVPAALLWHAILHARALGVSAFDFEGSSIPGIADFFSRFGGSVQPYLTLQKNTSAVWQLVRRLRA